MSELDNRPALDDNKAWRIYWRARGQAWRTEPEIDQERQDYLAQRQAIKPFIEQGIYPFKDIKLSRADIEWLLATHENGRGPIWWSDPNHQRRDGLDLRGADLRGVDLKHLPLSRMRGGLADDEWNEATEEQRRWAAVHLEGADLSYANLEDAELAYAYLQEASLYTAHLEDADMFGVQLNGDFPALLQFAFLNGGTKLENAIFSNKQHVGPRLADMHLDDVNLTSIDWSNVRILGDEYVAYQKRTRDGRVVDRAWKLIRFRTAIRAYRQLSTILRSQGVNEEANYFGYRAQVCQRKALWQQQKIRGFLGSAFLELLAGYGYKPIRSVITYIIINIIFAFIYATLAYFGLTAEKFLSWDSPLILSLTSFHGRVFFAGNLPLTDWAARVGALEAAIGLLIEVTFIATFTQKVFGK